MIARMRLTGIVRANTFVGAKHPVSMVPWMHEGEPRMLSPLHGITIMGWMWVVWASVGVSSPASGPDSRAVRTRCNGRSW